jgi:NTP pyrophosphatase (non-canonical NTP hydrolase)
VAGAAGAAFAAPQNGGAFRSRQGRERACYHSAMKDLERELLAYLKERNWHRLRPSDVAKSIAIEAAELLELFQWIDLTVAQAKKDKKKMQQLKEELADVFIYCLEMAVLLGLDTKKIIRDKLELARKKYPAKLVRNIADRRNPGTEKMYWKIKEEYRRRNRK